MSALASKRPDLAGRREPTTVCGAVLPRSTAKPKRDAVIRGRGGEVVHARASKRLAPLRMWDADSPKRHAKPKRGDDFMRGFAIALSILQFGWGEHGLVVMMLRESGLTYDDLRDGGADAHDLKLIRQAFKQNFTPLRPAATGKR